MAGIISKRTLEEVRFKNDIADVVGSYLPLKRSGSSLKALCPFHKEKTPSFHVNQERQIFHCFGCGAGGDVFRFVMQYEGVDFVTAAKMLAEKAGVRIEFDGGAGEDAADKTALYRLLDEVAQFYQRILLKSPVAADARKYLAERELSDEIVRDFGIGFVPDRWDSVIAWARQHKRAMSEIETAGLVVKSAKANSPSGFYDRFRNRLMFPIHDGQGRVVGFSGRTIGSDKDTAKYVNSPETPLFRKSHILYALHRARHPMVEQREAIVCEGQIDVIRCHSAGFTNAVASQGTAFTEDHARIVRRCADSVVLVFDPDTAGRDAAVKAARVFMRSGLAVRAAMLPEGEDPDSFIKTKGANAFRNVLDTAVSALAFQVSVLRSREDLRSEVGLIRASKAVLATIAESPNAVQRSRLLQEASDLLGVPESALEEELRHSMKRAEPAERETPGTRPPSAPPPPEELRLVEHLVAKHDLAGLVRKYLPLEMVADPLCARLIRSVLTAEESGKDLTAVVGDYDDKEGVLSRFASRLQMEPPKISGREFSAETAVKDLILHIRRRETRKKRREMEREMQSGQGAKNDSARLEHAHLTADLKLLDKWETAAPLLD